MTGTMAEFDQIERTIDIDATASRVWAVVVDPGWWVNDGASLQEHSIRRDGSIITVIDPEHGDFIFEELQRDEPRYIKFRWLADVNAPEKGSTFVEMWISDRPDGVTVRVVEQGFASLNDEAALRRSRFDDHTQGWPAELELLRTHTEANEPGANGIGANGRG